MPHAPSSTPFDEALRETAYRPARWLPTGLLQTLWATRRPRWTAPPLRLERWPTPDDDFVRVHLTTNAPPDRPLVLLLHGLEGSIASSYVVATAADAARRGWAFAALEFRSCGGELNRTQRTYHSGATEDIDLVVRRLGGAEPARPLFVLGVSLGGNALLKWLGENGDSAPVTAAAAISPPFDLAAASARADRWLGGVIARHFMATLVPKALAKAAQFPGLLDTARIRRCRTFAEFDDAVTAPLHGFRDAPHYWAAASCGPFLPAVRRPTALFAAADDPLVPAASIPRDVAAVHPHLVPQFTRHGGHVGFVTGASPLSSRNWAIEQAMRFFALVDAPAAEARGAATIG